MCDTVTPEVVGLCESVCHTCNHCYVTLETQPVVMMGSETNEHSDVICVCVTKQCLMVRARLRVQAGPPPCRQG